MLELGRSGNRLDKRGEGAEDKAQENSAMGGKVLNAVIFGLIIWVLIILSIIPLSYSGLDRGLDNILIISFFVSPIIAGIINYYYTKDVLKFIITVSLTFVLLIIVGFFIFILGGGAGPYH